MDSASNASRHATSAEASRGSCIVIWSSIKVSGGMAAKLGIAWVTHPLLNLVEYSLRKCVEHILHVLAGKRASFQKQDVLLLCKTTSLQERHLSFFLEVTLIANCNDRDILPCLLPSILQPRWEVVVGVARGHIIQYQSTNRSPVVRSRNCAVSFLPCSIPNLQLDLPHAYGDNLCPKLHAYGVGGLFPELPLQELMHEARLSSSGVANDDQLEAIVALRPLVLVLLVIVHLDKVPQLHW
mmetsp:Transcript_28056/g.64776  ORF Transcript_28056/g.64776 Transcript_28056/m.64776 type:complete len:240 (-) Transcript_28056:35-754(-)